MTLGYIGGASQLEKNGPARLWINGAINSGNSGGPLVLTETGEVIGVVVSKLAPVPPEIVSALDAMSSQRSGVVYNERMADGTTVNLSEAQVIAAVLQYLRGQTQLVIGMAVMPGDIAAFLRAHGVTP